MQEDYDFDWNHARRSKSKMSLFSATSSPSSRAGLGTVFNLTIFCLIKNIFMFFNQLSVVIFNITTTNMTTIFERNEDCVTGFLK